MPSTIPFTIGITGTIAANGTLEFTYKAPNGQDMTITRLQILPTSTCNLIRLQTDDGRQYSNLSSANPLKSSELMQSNTDINTVNPFKYPLQLKGGTTLTLEFADTSGSSNAVNLYLEASQVIP